MPFKILTIGDVHGSDVLSRVKPSGFDKIVFIGDYADTHHESEFSDLAILTNLKKIIEFKEQHPDKVVLLLGNHDVHYMYHEEVGRYSNFRPSMLADLRAIYLDHSPLFQMAYEYKTHLFTHAGISNKWFNTYNAAIHRELIALSRDTGVRPLKLSAKLNALRASAIGRQILFSVSGWRIFPRDTRRPGGILWADKRETQHDFLKHYHQVVGHTVVKTIETWLDPDDPNSSITYIDNENNEFYELSIE